MRLSGIFRGPRLALVLALLSDIRYYAEGREFGQTLQAPLKTKYTDEVGDAAVPLPEYPRPRMARPDWLNLNGEWDYMGGKSLLSPAEYPTSVPEFDENSEKIKVPFPPESFLSGVMRDLEINMWYRRNFSIPAEWRKKTILLQFGGIAVTSSIYVNGHLAGHHQGRWEAFSLDVTELLQEGSNTLIVGANDPHDGRSSCGKGVIDLGDYTFTSGIWQTVWLEPVPKSHITDLEITPALEDSTVSIKVNVDGRQADVEALVYADEKIVDTGKGINGSQIILPIRNLRVWSPDDPFLYELRARLLDENGEQVDDVKSYFGMRSSKLGDVDGTLKPLLNGKFVPQVGLLDKAIGQMAVNCAVHTHFPGPNKSEASQLRKSDFHHK